LPITIIPSALASTTLGRRAALVGSGAATLALAELAKGGGAAQAKTHKHKNWRKKCQKRCKKAGKQCSRDCDILETDVDLCKNECQVAKKQCKKVC